MNLDELNNSQMALLTIVVGVFVSSAVSVSVISLLIPRVYDLKKEEIQEPKTTIVRHIINTPIGEVDEEEKNNETEINHPITFDRLTSITAEIYLENSYLLHGVFINEKAYVAAYTNFNRNKVYNVNVDGRIIDYMVKGVYNDYTVLAPLNETVLTGNYIKPIIFENITLGSSAVVYSRYYEEESIFSEIVSRLDKDKSRFHTSINTAEVDSFHMVFIDKYFAGFLSPQKKGWIEPIPSDFITKNNI